MVFANRIGQSNAHAIALNSQPNTSTNQIIAWFIGPGCRQHEAVGIFVEKAQTVAQDSADCQGGNDAQPDD